MCGSQWHLIFVGFFSKFGVPLGLGDPSVVRFGCWEQSWLASWDLEVQITDRSFHLMQWVGACPVQGSVVY